MPRPRKNPIAPTAGDNTHFFSTWAESLGETLGRSIARGLSSVLSPLTLGSAGASAPTLSSARRRGRPSKAQTGGTVAPERVCKIPGCGREARSKGLCSAHYQAERRRLLAKAADKA